MQLLPAPNVAQQTPKTQKRTIKIVKQVLVQPPAVSSAYDMSIRCDAITSVNKVRE